MTKHISRLRGAHAIDYSTLYSGLPLTWEELVGLKNQVLRPNLSASFSCLGNIR